ncbi:MAG: hypothetical protein MRY63_13565 [Neomegalonema sp.]|nr:hypothetical protein [Neomegalonema sp.]
MFALNWQRALTGRPGLDALFAAASKLRAGTALAQTYGLAAGLPPGLIGDLKALREGEIARADRLVAAKGGTHARAIAASLRPICWQGTSSRETTQSQAQKARCLFVLPGISPQFVLWAARRYRFAMILCPSTCTLGPTPDLPVEIYDASTVLHSVGASREIEHVLAGRFAASLMTELEASLSEEARSRLCLRSLTRDLKDRGAAEILQTHLLLSQIGKIPPSLSITLATGEDDWRAIAMALLHRIGPERGFETLCLARNVEARLMALHWAREIPQQHEASGAAYAPQQRQPVDAPPLPDPEPAARRILQNRRWRRQWRALAKATRAARKPAALLLADFRPSRIERWTRPAGAVLARIAARRPVALLQPHYFTGGRARARFAAQIDRLDTEAAFIGLPLQLSQHDRQSFTRFAASLITRTRSAQDRAPAHELEPALRPAFDLAAMKVLSHDWPRNCALSRALEIEMAHVRPAYCLIMPGARPFAGPLIEAAQRLGLPNIEAQGLLMSASPRYDAPMTDVFCCIDTEQARLLEQVHNIAPDRLRICGALQIEPRPDAASGGAQAPGNAHPLTWPISDAKTSGPAPLRLLLASQPLGPRMSEAVDRVARALEACPRLSLVMTPHPSEPPSAIEAHRARLAALEAQGRVVFWHRGLESDALIEGADTVITLFSNVGLRAAAAGKPVIALQSQIPHPVDFAALGLALPAGDEAELLQALHAIENDLPAARQLKARQAGFLADNPALVAGDAVERIVRAAEELSVCKRPPGDAPR